MKKFTSFLVLSFLAAAQDLSQLAGVKLTGKVDSPVVENHSGRTVIPVTVWLQQADGDGPVHHSYYPKTGIPDGKSGQAAKDCDAPD